VALSDWYEVRHRQFFASREILNVYHALRSGPAFTAADVAQAFIDTILPLVEAIEGTTVSGLSLVVTNLGNATDFQEVDISTSQGTLVGQLYAPFVAPRIQFFRERTDMKHGWKRYTGATEDVLSGEAITISYQAALQALADAIIGDWEEASAPGVTVANFGIIARVCAEFSGAGVCLSYRLPENDAELEFYLPTSAQARTVVGSQNTRKAGVGI